jgi:hypothetical protein
MSLKSLTLGGRELAQFRLRNALLRREFPGILAHACVRAALCLCGFLNNPPCFFVILGSVSGPEPIFFSLRETNSTHSQCIAEVTTLRFCEANAPVAAQQHK